MDNVMAVAAGAVPRFRIRTVPGYKIREPLKLASTSSILHDEALPLTPTQFAQPLEECAEEMP